MILIISHTLDFTTDIIIDKLNKRNEPYYRLNTNFPKSSDLSINFNYEEISSIRKEIKSIWIRRFLSPEFDNNLENIDWMKKEFKAFIYNYINSFDLKIMSDPYSIDRAENKSFQLLIAQKLGFNIPKTLISSNKFEIIKFINSSQGRYIIKPIYFNRLHDENGDYHIFTNIISESDLSKIETSFEFPSIYQEFIEKDYDIRVTVVGNDIFSAVVKSQQNDITKIDWRRERIKFEKYELPIELKNLCLEIVKSLGLNFGAIDLVKSIDGNYYFLEINPNGQWGWIEYDTDLQISDSIINWLN